MSSANASKSASSASWRRLLKVVPLGSDRRFGFTSSGSIETFKEFIECLAQSFRDLVTVRDLAQEVVSRNATAEPTLAERCGVVGSQISCAGKTCDMQSRTSSLALSGWAR
jgi:hypothetical protein